MIRKIELSDIEKLEKLRAKYHPEDPPINFMKGFYAPFIIEDDEGIITAGGVRPIAEIVLITNLKRDILDRKTALLNALNIGIHITSQMGYDHLHAFVQDEKWCKRLMRSGFKEPKGKALILDV